MPRYQRKMTTVEAIQINQDVVVEAKENGKPKSIGVNKNDWLVTEDSGIQYFLTDAEFQAQFEPEVS